MHFFESSMNGMSPWWNGTSDSVEQSEKRRKILSLTDCMELPWIKVFQSCRQLLSSFVKIGKKLEWIYNTKNLLVNM